MYSESTAGSGVRDGVKEEGGRKALGKWVRPVCHPRHIHTECSPQRETQTVQHAAERRDDRRRGRRRRGETREKMSRSRRLQMDRRKRGWKDGGTDVLALI